MIERFVILLSCVEVRNVYKKYGNFLALEDISLEIEKGDFVAILGPNGAGKSTLMKIMSTLLKGYSGNIKICGYDIEKDAKIVRQKIGVVPENFLLYDKLSAWENMIFFGGLYHLSKKTLVERAEKLLKDIEMWKWKDKKIKEFSFGMKQKLNIARAFMNEPEVIFLDEPTVSLDIKSMLVVKKLLKEMNDKGKTIIFTTHILTEVEEMANKIAILNFGHLTAFGTLNELSNQIGDKTLMVEFDNHLDRGFFDQEGVKVQQKGQKMIFTYSSHEELDKIIGLIAKFGVSLKSINSSQGDLKELLLKFIDKGRDKN